MSLLQQRICRQGKPLLRLLRPRRGFFIFLVFLVLSGLFWLSTALNDSYDCELDLPVAIKNVPANVVLTNDSIDIVRVTVRDKGYTLLQYARRKGVMPVEIDFSAYPKQNGKCVVSASELHKLITKRLQNSTSVSTVKPDKMDLCYVEGTGKSVSVRLTGNFTPAKNYYLEHTEIEPSRVTLYASPGEIDSIQYVFTENLQMKNFSDTVSATVKIKQMPRMKTVPDEVTVTFFPDILTEDEAEVRITTVNVPDGTILRTFPSRVKVKYTVGVSMYRNVNLSQFKIQADYGSITESTDKCRLSLVQIPKGVKQASLETSEVDYLIEN